MSDAIAQCAFSTFSGYACTRPAMTETPAGHRFCGVSHERGTGGRNDVCSCGSGRKYKKCCGPLPVGAEHQVFFLEEGIDQDQAPNMKTSGGLAKATKKTVYSVGYNVRRWIIGYERDRRWRANILYLGPFYFSRRSRTPRR